MARYLSIRTDSPEVIPDTRPYGCYEGWVYLGFEGENENGEYAEVIERVPCRRCHATTSPFSPARVPTGLTASCEGAA
jgi:hypothetical protein